MMAEVTSPGITSAQLDAALPKPASAMPPAVADAGARGTETVQYALADHTHASKTRRIRAQSAADGLMVWTFDPPFDVGVVPRVYAIAETTSGVTDVVNVQIEGTPTNTSANLRVNRTQRSVASLLGLTILSVPAQPGVTWVHAFASANT